MGPWTAAGIAAFALAEARRHDAPMNPRGLIERIGACYPPEMTPAQWEIASGVFGLRPAWAALSGTDFFLDQSAWVGEGGVGDSGYATRAELTFSFVADGTEWGPSSYVHGPSALMAGLSLSFGEETIDRGLEFMRQALAAYRQAGITLREVADDGEPWGVQGGPPARGDIRIGGIDSTDPLLGISTFPSSGSDVALNTSYFVNGNLGSGAQSYLYLRNTTTHEFAHALGMAHSVPCDNTKLLEPILALGLDGLGVDDIRGMQRNYGDRFSGNGDLAHAVALGDLTGRSVILDGLSTNGADAFFNHTDRDWFTFRITTPQPVFARLTQRGGQYLAARQDVHCSAVGQIPLVNAQGAGRLSLDIRDAATGQLVFANSPDPLGSGQTISASLPAGDYAVRVIDVGPANAANLRVQLYDLELACGASPTPAPPRAIAGLGKLAIANRPTYFMGDLHSRALAPGAMLTPASYDWDLNGDGVFETLGEPRPVHHYVSNGEYLVTLRVTDSNAQAATDTIPVDVRGGVSRIFAVAPPVIRRGVGTPVTVYGTNLRNVVGANEVTVSALGAFVSGAPAPNADGTVITGLVIQTFSNVELGPATMFIVNQDGQAIGLNAITIVAGPACPADVNGDGVVGLADLVIVIETFGEAGVTTPADVNGDSRVDFLDLNTLLSAFGTAC